MLLSILLALSPTADAHGNGHKSHSHSSHHSSSHSSHHSSHSSSHYRPAKVRTGQLVVHNASYQQVQVFVDGISYGYLSNGSMALSVNAGSHRVKVVHNGRVLNNRDVMIYGGSQASVSVNIPTVGQVWVTNYEPYPVFVYVDGRQITTLAAGEVRCLDVALGGHRVDLVDARQYGSTVVSVSVSLDGWSAGAVATPQRQASHGHQRPR
jgi:hypothetical protein